MIAMLGSVPADTQASPAVVDARFCQCAGSRPPWKQAIPVSVATSSMTNINA
jgi:hypothetical protein